MAHAGGGAPDTDGRTGMGAQADVAAWPYEARVRRDKMVAELSAAKKESSFYMRKVEQAKAIDAMEDRKKRRLASTHDGETTATAAGQKRQRDATAGDATEAEADGLANVRRRFAGAGLAFRTQEATLAVFFIAMV